MSYKREIFDKLYDIFIEIEKKIKRKNASKKPKIIKAREYLIIYSYNSILKQVQYCKETESEDKREIEEKFEEIENKLQECLQILESEYRLPNEIKPIEIERTQDLGGKERKIEIELDKIERPDEEIDDVDRTENSNETTDSDTETDEKADTKENQNNNENRDNNGNDNDNNKNNNENNQNRIGIKEKTMEAVTVIENLNRIMKDSFDGEPSNLNNFISKIALAKTIVADNQPNVFLAFIKTRLVGKALEYATEAQNVDEVINILKSKIKPENSRVLINRLTSIRMNNSKKSEFAEEIEKTAELLRLALIAEKIPNDVAKNMVIDKTIEACNLNARSDRIKSILSAKSFKTTAEIVSELFIQIDTCKIEHQINTLRISNNNRNRVNNYRGNRGRGYNRQNNRYNTNRYQNNNNYRYNNNSYNRNNYRNNNNNRGYSSNRGNYNRNNRPRGNFQRNNNNNQRNVRFLGENASDGETQTRNTPRERQQYQNNE